MTGHIHAESMKQYAEDAATHDRPWSLWEEKNHDGGFRNLIHHPSWAKSNEYRRKPRTININGFEVPEPIRERPDIGNVYYIVVIGNDEITREAEWSDYGYEVDLLNKGLLHTTKEAAELHAKALLSFTRNDG